MSNKLDILRDYQVAVEKITELDHVCEEISQSNRGRHLLEAYDEKKRNAEAERDRLEDILEAMAAAED
ncbi:hypothetical protein [Liquorilactobacillus satsumensis]|uniref:Uncharacterized protein n=1 Tax=Liquorilactobacillus satsumensis DSM 16230 = JCM 12392 TaxID=1423801 RepID=A0A0R1UWK7_9LACO|nr:hypothetical protein [Liquorilactobacillus satsumensis]KRL97543.1 hypothetical protein FD50_GL001529 [Liquorilactobacillus satsumensis DSM 16230 = JCM 12392]MCC7666690.1 hypothetical protein [Liquorilactobacillus satsumensis]MCP9312690.1 hypothetical protein [Liquorilactobacillus satsumensis]MCP9327531.1 hypothetical protein [Liquorilactobacillus satsumensis]MCP9357567.1 hypothetical protein [Liquorilactobacillus satsumensis]